MGVIPTENRILYYDEFVSFQYHENYLSSNITELLVKDYLYQQFKYDFSYYVNEYNNIKYKKDIVKLIENPKHNLNLQHSSYVELIKTMMKPLVSSTLKNIVQVDEGLYIGVCYKYKSKNSCHKNILCNFDKKDKKCKLNMSEEYLSLFSYLLANDLIKLGSYFSL